MARNVGERRGACDLSVAWVLGVLVLLYVGTYAALRQTGFFARTAYYTGPVTVVSGRVMTKPGGFVIFHRGECTALSRNVSQASCNWELVGSPPLPSWAAFRSAIPRL